MPSFRTTRRVQHAAGDMFDLVAAVERYPEFVPLCKTLVVKNRVVLPDGRSQLTADMTVAYKVFHETFTSRVTLDRPRLEILVNYLNGPFRALENRWSFRAQDPHTCDIDFFIIYEFRSRTLGMVMGTVFDSAFRRFAEAFERRADQVYGQPARA
jgi:coenzyme Q-binding protein COQ10